MSSTFVLSLKKFAFYQVVVVLSLNLFVSASLQASTGTYQGANSQRPNVLILIKDAPDLPWNRALTASIEDKFYAQYPQGRLFYEFLDIDMLPNVSQTMLREFVTTKYQDSRIDAIIYDGISAIELLQSNEAFKPEASHILLRYTSRYYEVNAAIEPFDLHIQENYRDVIISSLKLTGANKAYLVYDPANTLALNGLQELRESISDAGLNKLVELVAFTNLQELLDAFSGVTENATVILSPILIRSDSSVMFPKQVTEYVAANINLPVFVHWDTLLNNEVAGGYVISSQKIGETTITGLVDALQGRVPRLYADNIYQSQYNKAELDTRGFSIAQLPSQSILYNAPADPFTLYFTELVSGIILMSCLVLFTSILVNRNRLLKKQQIQLFQSEEELRCANERLNAATCITQLGIWDYSSNSGLYAWDNWMYKHHDQDPSTFSPSLNNWANLLPENEASKLKECLQNAIHKGQDVQLEYAFTLTNGDTRHISLYCHAVVNIGQTTLQLVGSAQDISQQVAQQKQLKVERDKAKAAVKAKSLFIASMSHEIRTPMNAIAGSAEMLANTGLDDDQAQHNSVIKHSAQSMLNVVNDILELARLENGKLKVERYSFNPSELIQQILASFRGEITNKNLKLKYKLENKLPQSVVSDPLRIKQVLFNLMTNAIKFTHQGHVGISLKYERSTETLSEDNKVSGTLTFVIHDSGIGIALEAQQRIFEKFVQSDQETFQKYGGTGLGLNISREIAHLLGGDLQVNSQLGEGSEFVFTVPVKTDISSKNKPEPHIRAATPRLADKTVLIADDIEINRVILEQALLDTHANVLFASNGQEAVDIFRSQKVDLVLMDVLMPVMDGIKATHIIRTSDSTLNSPHIPIVAFTAQATDDDKDLCLGEGMDAYLTKPINQQLLFSTILSFPELSSPVTFASSSGYVSE